MTNIGIIVFSNTGHTLEVAKKLKKAYEKNGHSVTLEQIKVKGGWSPDKKDFKFEKPLPDLDVDRAPPLVYRVRDLERDPDDAGRQGRRPGNRLALAARRRKGARLGLPRVVHLVPVLVHRLALEHEHTARRNVALVLVNGDAPGRPVREGHLLVAGGAQKKNR